MNTSLNIFILLLSLVITSNAQNNGVTTTMPEKGLCAHRGDMTKYPENTLLALVSAAESGAHMIEFDVRLTADKKLVIMHDATVDRTTNGSGMVSEMQFDEIRKLDAGGWMSDEFRSLRVPTFQEVLERMPVNVWLNIHIKGDPLIGKLVAQEVMKQNRLHQSFLACSKDVALEAKKISEEIKICNMDRQDSNWDYVNQTIARNSDFIQLKGDISPVYKSMVEKLLESGVQINYFGTDDETELNQLFGYGVQFPLVNDYSQSIQIAEKLGVVRNIPEFFNE